MEQKKFDLLRERGYQEHELRELCNKKGDFLIKIKSKEQELQDYRNKTNEIEEELISFKEEYEKELESIQHAIGIKKISLKTANDHIVNDEGGIEEI